MRLSPVRMWPHAEARASLTLAVEVVTELIAY